MTPLVDDPDFTLYLGDVTDVLARLPDESVHCVVTSPPYWGLRDYGTGTWDGGDPDCDHLEKVGGTGASTLGEASGGHAMSAEARLRATTRSYVPYRDVCGKCGARRVDQQLGLEPTPDEYVNRIVQVFREVRRVLRRDGTCWINLGDSYASGPRGNADDDWSTSGLNGAQTSAKYRTTLASGTAQTRDKTRIPGLKPKDLVGMPWRVAFALQADGWWLRSEITWAKKNCMPESVTDRPTTATEKVFLLAKSPRYFYDADAVREEAAWERWGDQTSPKYRNGFRGEADGPSAYPHQSPGQNNSVMPKAATIPDKTKDELQEMAARGRNLRNWWAIATEPYPDAHFATFPQALVEPCIKAGTSEHGCCPECGAPWVRETERSHDKTSPKSESDFFGDGRDPGVHRKLGSAYSKQLNARPPRTLGWRPGCQCISIPVPVWPNPPEFDPVPCVVLDPFMGSGTTALVARRLGRRCVGIELNEEYAELAARRLQQQSLFA